MARKFVVRRTVTKDECPWLKHELTSGNILFEFRGPTYGCVGLDGRAMSWVEDEGPFFEVPRDSVMVVPPKGDQGGE